MFVSKKGWNTTQMSSYNLAIVVVAYNRAVPLNNLLQSVQNLRTEDKEIDLIISIDNKGTPEVVEVARDFEWNRGKKEVIIRKEKLGLKNQFIWAGDMTLKYDHVLFLEDDLYLSPYALDYVDAYVRNYDNDERIAGASLYNPILK